MDEEGLARHDRAFGKRAEFGEVIHASGRTLNQISWAQVEGARNLLSKALAAVAAGDADRAEKLIERAATMPFDARERWSPGLRAAENLLYDQIADHFEGSDLSDQKWLEVALTVHGRVEGAGKAELASAVNGFVLQKGAFELTPTETRRIQEAVGDAPLEVDFGDGPDMSVDKKRDIIRSIVLAVRALEDAYAADPTDAPTS